MWVACTNFDLEKSYQDEEQPLPSKTEHRWCEGCSGDNVV